MCNPKICPPPTPPLSLSLHSVGPSWWTLGNSPASLRHDALSITRMRPPEGPPTPGRPFPAPSITRGERSDGNAGVEPAARPGCVPAEVEHGSHFHTFLRGNPTLQPSTAGRSSPVLSGRRGILSFFCGHGFLTGAQMFCGVFEGFCEPVPSPELRHG